MSVRPSFLVLAFLLSFAAAQQQNNYNAVRTAIKVKLDDPTWDDGSWGPVLLRLAWHAAGSYSKVDHTGGSNGATMRFQPEAGFGANKGLDHARDFLEPIKAQFSWISYSDLWSLAGTVAIEAMGGPKVAWRPGRVDKPDGSYCPPDGRLPDASKPVYIGAQHLRDIFGRMGFDDREIVALAGAHSVGRCHTDRSGWVGPWTGHPTAFTNHYFKNLLKVTWVRKEWDGPEQYDDPNGKIMMLPTDMALLWDPVLRQYVQMYAKDEALFFKDFASAFKKLQENGVTFTEDQLPIEDPGDAILLSSAL